MGDEDPTTWQVALAFGVGLMTYGSTAALRPAARPLFIPPTTTARCDRCISSIDDGLTLSASRQLDGWFRATILVQADNAPAFSDHVTIAAGGLGVSALAPSSPFGGHIDILAGAGWVLGPVDATSFAISSLGGVDVRIARDAYVGLSFSYVELLGAQPAGTGAVSSYGVELRYRWR
jgi:hypothetical protein